ncbi:MAG: aspartate carbamoyltransferase [Spirochaetia bacterium]|nr:aspartate carbamoyltransferase [Spirochaetia bacterium]
MQVKSILTADQFTRSDLDLILNKTALIESLLKNHKQLNILNEYILATMFFEPSTRTRLSFESAMHRLGGRVVTAVGMQFSSLAKGETLFDTLKVLESYADICAIRHPVEGASTVAAKSISIPVINAGDGAGEHPTQAILDLYTISVYKDIIHKKIKVGFVGDIKYGRTIHSLIKLLSKYNASFIFISPSEIGLPDKYKEALTNQNIEYKETSDIDALAECDVGYITRIQEERFLDHSTFEKFKDLYIINKNLLKKCREDIIIMHPLPRLNEVSTEIDQMPQAVYFKQAEYGLYSRMTLLLYVTGLLDKLDAFK